MDYRKRIDMTPSELGWTAIALVGLGTLMGWALFGEHRLIEWVFDSGNAAEWAAALGTWIIGYGAWRYAREGHRQRLAEYSAARQELATRRSAKFADMYLRTAKFTGMLELLIEYNTSAPAERTRDRAGDLLDDAVAAATELHYSEEDKSYLTRSMVGPFRSAMNNRDFFVEACELLQKALTDRKDEPLTATQEVWLGHLVDRIKIMTARLETLNELFEAQID